MRPHSLFTVLPLSLTLGLVTAHAQVTPDAGSIRQQLDPSRALPSLPPAAAPQRVVPPTEMAHQKSLTVRVDSFQFVGNTLLGNDQLAAALSVFVKRDLSFNELQRAADAVAMTYREAGWMVRVYLPEQDISSGLVTLQIVEARFGGLRFEGEAPKHVLPAEIQSYFEAQQQLGQALNVDSLDRALLLADDLPGVNIAGTLVPGPQDNETSLVLNTTDEPLVYGDISLDNNGARSTGSDRVMLNMNITSPGERGELISLNLLHSKGSDYSRVAFTVPDGYNGLRVGINASTMTYKVIDGPATNSAAQIRGSSNSMGFDMNYPLLRSRLANVYWSGGLDNKTFFNEDAQVRSDYASAVWRVGLSVNRFDDLGGGGANTASVQMVRGQLEDMKAHNLLNSIDRSFSKVNYSLSRQQTLTADHSLLIAMNGQYATQVLDSSEKFYIGGAQTVRAYPVSEFGGDRGQVLSSEWRWRVAASWTATAFVDAARVTTLPTTASDSTTTLFLRGQGLSVGWQDPSGLTAKLTWSRRNGHNPKPTSAGTDGDGTLKLNRIWFNTSLAF